MANRKITHIGVVALGKDTTFVIEGKNIQVDTDPKRTDQVRGIEKYQHVPTGREYEGIITKDIGKKDRFVASIHRTDTVHKRPDLDEIEITVTNAAGAEPSNAYPADAVDADP